MPWEPDYIDLEEAKDFVRVGDDVDDVELALIVTAASRAIDNRCHRQFGQVDTPEERFYTAHWSRTLGRWVAEIDDLATTEDLVVLADGVAVTDYRLVPLNAVAKSRVWTGVVLGGGIAPAEDLAITGRWGWPAVLATIATAARLQVNRFLSRRDSPYGIAGSPSDGSEMRLLSRLDPDVDLMISGLVRIWVAR
jgi:uncharacterized protein related to proFAR isomerase